MVFLLGCFAVGFYVRELSLDWNRDLEGGAVSRFTFRFYLSSHQLRQLLADGKSQAGPSIFPSGGPICLDEGLEQFGKGVGGNADPMIRHGEADIGHSVFRCGGDAISDGRKFEAPIRRS